jgi:ADP-heptose:LPS heptosyltransferase
MIRNPEGQRTGDHKPDPSRTGLLQRLREPPRRVAVVRPSRLGDLVCATPALRALRAALPRAEIVLITLPLLRDLAVRLPSLDGYVAFPGYPGLAEQLFDARRTLGFFAQMQAAELDLAVQMHESGIYSNPFTLMLGARVTAGFVRPGDGPGRLDAALPIPRQGHEIDRLLALADFLGAFPQGRHTDFPLWPGDRTTAAALLAGVEEPLIGVHPGARNPARIWNPQELGVAAAGLRHLYGGTVVVLAGPGEEDLAGAVAGAAGRPCLTLAGRTPLSVLGAVIDRLAVLIGNDSGPAHVAYALGTPAVVVCDGSSLERYGPPVEGPFRVVTAAHLEQLSVNEVLSAAAELIRLPSSRSQEVRVP